MSHWAQHKLHCKSAKTYNQTILEKTNIKNGYSDMVRWVDFYATPIKNALVAALNLPDHSHQERHSALVIQITHKGDKSLPLERRFAIDSIERCDGGEGGFTSQLVANYLDSDQMKGMRHFEETVEMKGNYYGTSMFLMQGVFTRGGVPLAASDPKELVTVPLMKFFSIPKDAAKAKVISGPWWIPLRWILENGERLRFCCRKLDEGICCCGGWLHEKDAKKGDAWR